MAYTHSVKTIVRIGGFAPLLAALFLGGCANDVAVQPEAANLLWKEVACPSRQTINCMAIDPEGRIFLGVRDRDDESRSLRSAIYISSDNGDTWTRKEFGFSDITSLAIDSEGRIFASGYYETKRSLNHGESWENLSLIPHASGEPGFIVDSSDNVYFKTLQGGIYFSGDHGDGWTQIGEGIIAAGELTSLAANSKGCLFAIAGRRLYKSCDRGVTWTGPEDGPWDNLFGQVAIDSGDRIFIHNQWSFYRSTDDGESWTTQEPPDMGHISWISIDGRDRLYLSCYSKLYVSDDGSDSWALIFDPWNQPICAASNAAGDVFATGWWGISRSIDGGASWEMLGFSAYEAADIAVGENGFYYLGLECGGVYRSLDSLGSWERFNAGLPDVGLSNFASANDSVWIAGTTNNVYVSPKARPAWSFAGPEGYHTWKVFAFPGDSVAATGHGLFVSPDGGHTWTDTGLNDYDIRALIRTADGRLLAGANFGGVFRYTGEGILWDQMNDGLGDLRVNALAVTRGGDILAGTDTGIFVSSNGGVFWRRFSKDQIKVTTVLVVDEDIFFGSEAGILWTRTDGAALCPQNDGLPSSVTGFIRSIAVDLDHHLLILAANRLFRSSQSTKELVPAGL